MSRGDRDLVAAIRAELASLDPGRPCDRTAESAGLGSNLVTREAAVARLAVRLGRGTDAGAILASRGHRPKHLHARRSATSATEAAAGGGVVASALDPMEFAWADSAEHCRLAWLRGRFLSRGSLSVSNGRTHLEFVVDPGEAPVLASRLAEMELPASWRLRRGRGVVTWKSAETIGLFLRRIGAGAALLELEARQVSRALRGDLNRVINAESANLQRSVHATSRQLAAINAVEHAQLLTSQPYRVRMVAEARRETPEATLSDLADRLELHRSAVQRALDRIERLASQAGDPGAESRGRPQAGLGARRGRSAPGVGEARRP